MKRLFKALVAVALSLSVNAQAAPLFTITDLGTLGGNHGIGWGVNDAGQVVGHAKLANGQWRAFIGDAVDDGPTVISIQ